MKDERIREILCKINMREMCESTGISYRRIRSYKCGILKRLRYDEVELIVNYINNIAKGV